MVNQGLRNWDLQNSLGLTMGYKFSWKSFLSYFSPHFLLFGRELELPRLIQ
jgi:hypothetical protein